MLYGKITAIVLVMVLAFSGCQSKTDDYSAVVATVNGVDITVETLRSYVWEGKQNEAETYRQMGMSSVNWDEVSENGKTRAMNLKEAAVENAILSVLYESHMEDAGVSKADIEAERETVLESMKEYYKAENSADLTKALEQYGFTSEESFMHRIYLDLLTEKMRVELQKNNSMFEGLEASDTDEVVVKHILISSRAEGYSEENADVDFETRKAEATRIITEVKTKLDAGEDFDDLLEQYDEDPGQRQPGFSGYKISPGSGMVQPFEDAALALDVNEVSDIVTTDFGYHILKRYNDIAVLEKKWRAEANVEIHNQALEAMSLPLLQEEV